MSHQQVAEPALSCEAFDVLRAAVTLARNENICKTGQLRLRLTQVLPEAPAAVVAEALRYWANHNAATQTHAH